jgi:hypothetical protein
VIADNVFNNSVEELLSDDRICPPNVAPYLLFVTLDL